MRNIIWAEMKAAYLWYNVYFSAKKETYIYCATILLGIRETNERNVGESILICLVYYKELSFILNTHNGINPLVLAVSISWDVTGLWN